jgi:hypothetical protein
MASASFLGSSRKSRRVPVLGAFCVGRRRCVENVYGGQIFVQHNMGLCCTDGKGGRGLRRKVSRLAVAGWWAAENYYKYWEKRSLGNSASLMKVSVSDRTF